MCKIVEERAKEYAKKQVNETQVENIKRMLCDGELSHEKIASLLNISLELVEKVAKETAA